MRNKFEFNYNVKEEPKKTYVFNILDDTLELEIKDPAGEPVITINKESGDIWIRDWDDLKHKFVWFFKDREEKGGSRYKLEFVDGKRI